MTNNLVQLIPFLVICVIVFRMFSKPRPFRAANKQSIARWKAFADRLGLHFSAVTNVENNNAGGWSIEGELDRTEIRIHQVIGDNTGMPLGISLSVLFRRELEFEFVAALRDDQTDSGDYGDDLTELTTTVSGLRDKAILLGEPLKKSQKWLDADDRQKTILGILTAYPNVTLTQEGLEQFMVGDFGGAGAEKSLANEETFEKTLRGMVRQLQQLHSA